MLLPRVLAVASGESNTDVQGSTGAMSNGAGRAAGTGDHAGGGANSARVTTVKVRISADDLVGLMRYMIAHAKPKHLMANVCRLSGSTRRCYPPCMRRRRC